MECACEQHGFDFFGYVQRPDGSYEIQKNGEHLLTCTGSEQEAKNIVALLNNDGRERGK